MKILGYTYTLVADGDNERMGAFGRQHTKSQTLQIATDLCAEQVVSTVLHEVIEAINYHLQLHLEHPVVMSLEAALYQVLTDNGVDLTPLARELKAEKE